jgi:hypothetical protein
MMDGSGGFWIFIAALVVGGMWSDARKKAERHETLRTIVEKTGTIDEARLKELFREDAAETPKPGYSYRAMRMAGTIVMFLGVAGATFLFVAITLGKLFSVTQMFNDVSGWIVGVAISAAVAVVGWGLFYSSRFATPPLPAPDEPPAR